MAQGHSPRVGYPVVDRRVCVRVAMSLPVVLMRTKGNAIASRTIDIGAGGMSVATDRPLGIDERLSFDLALGEGQGSIGGHARVVREPAIHTYAMRFEDLAPDAAASLSRLFTDA